ncbi:MAG TPA: hypothetical protein VH277_04060 [Gemmatimonadaceae bacterium]|nr:hypothetical protein [Gemmatimonadaceae bacterium]
MRRVIVAAVACTPLACGFLESPTPNVDVSGTWALRSISGATLTDEPATIGGTYSVKGSALTLTEFSEPGPPPITVTLTVSVSHGTLTTWQGTVNRIYTRQ